MKRTVLALLCILAGGALPASTQTVAPADLVGTWRGNVTQEFTLGSKWDSVPGKPMSQGRYLGEIKGVRHGIGWLVLRPDSLWWEWNSADGEGREWGSQDAGRWRLVGDSLWLGVGEEYRPWTSVQREASKKVDDTTGIAVVRKADSLALLRKAEAVTWGTSAMRRMYKVTLKDQQLSLVPVDSLAKNPQTAPVAVYQRH